MLSSKAKLGSNSIKLNNTRMPCMMTKTTPSIVEIIDLVGLPAVQLYLRWYGTQVDILMWIKLHYNQTSFIGLEF